MYLLPIIFPLQLTYFFRYSLIANFLDEDITVIYHISLLSNHFWILWNLGATHAMDTVHLESENVSR